LFCKATIIDLSFLMRSDSLCYGSSTGDMDALGWDIALADIVHCSFFGIDQPSFLIQRGYLPILAEHINKPPHIQRPRALFFVSWFGHILAWRLRLCCAISSLSLNAFSARSFCASGSPFALSGSDGLRLFRCVVMDGQAGRLDAHFCTV